MAEVMAESARQVNLELRIASFGEVDEANLDTFLAGVDVCIDAIDFSVLPIRRARWRAAPSSAFR